MMGRKRKKGRRKQPGLPPGSLIYTGSHEGGESRIHCMAFGKDHCVEEPVNEIGSLTVPAAGEANVMWVNLDGLSDVAGTEALGLRFGVHPLVLEDILHTDHRPKAEEYDNYLFFTLKMLDIHEDGDLTSEQVSIILGRNFLLSFQERPGDIFDPVRDRIRAGKGKAREKKADYLAYLLLDAVIDRYFIILDRVANRIETLEKKIMEDNANEILFDIQGMKTQLVELRKAIYPLREAVGYIERIGVDFVMKDTRKYFRDLYDHTVQVIDQLDGMRELVSSLQDLYHSMMSNRMNNIMKVLTIMASIFIPLTFIAGVYGMNFEYMPELHFRYGYYGVWILMIVTALVMIRYFRRKRWL